MDYINIGAVPHEEPCVAVGRGDYEGPMRDECEVFKRMLLRLNPPPAGSSGELLVRRQEHDFGPYYEVEAGFKPDDGGAAEWAFGLEANVPDHWDDIAAYELQWIRSSRALERTEQRPRTALEQWPVVPAGCSLSELLSRHPLPGAAVSLIT